MPLTRITLACSSQQKRGSHGEEELAPTHSMNPSLTVLFYCIKEVQLYLVCFYIFHLQYPQIAL